MDRKGLLIILITIGVAFAWQFLYVKPRYEEEVKRYREAKEKFDAEQAKQKEAAAAAGTTQEPGTPGASAPAPAPVVEKPVQPAEPEQIKTFSSEVGTVDYVFTTHGGGISRVVLKEHFDSKEKGTLVVLNEFGEIPIGALADEPGNLDQVKEPWKMSVDDTQRVITFEQTRPGRLQGRDSGTLKVTKRFTLPEKPDENDKRRQKLRSEYLLDYEVTYQNIGEMYTEVPGRFVHIGGAAPINEGEVRLYQGFDYWRDGDNHFHDVEWFSAGGILLWKHPERPVFRQDTDLIRWTAVTNQYFTTLFTVLGAEDKSEEEQRALLGVAAWAKRRTISPEEWRAPSEWRPQGHHLAGGTPLHHVDGAIGLPGMKLLPQQAETRKYQIYAGPREYRRLRLLDHEEEDVLDYGSFLGIGWFSKGLLNAMNGLYYYVTRNYALAIVLLTIFVKALLWPLQGKANRNMKKMAELQPQMKALEKYKQDPVKYQQEMGKLFKKMGVNPLSGCWPIMIQIPIFIGFYNMLGKAVELRHHGFLWVNDLAAPDTVAHFIGIPINPLPLLMAVTMFLQMKMAPQGGDPMQRKIFMFMPLIFIFLCYNFASALALYWTVQNIISIVQLLINRSNQPVVAQAAPAK